DRIGPLQPRTPLVEPAPRILVEERRAAAATRQAPLLEAEDEDRVEAPGARPPEVDDRDTSHVVAGPARKRSTLDGCENFLAAQPAGELTPTVELGEQAPQRLVGTKVETARSVGGRPLEAVRVPQHLLHELADRLDGVGGLAQLRQRGQRPAAQTLGLF